MRATRIVRSILSILVLATAFALLAQDLVRAAGPCQDSKALRYMGTKVRREATGRYYGYVIEAAAVKIDADGAPNAYHPDDLGKHCISGGAVRGLDCPANAGYPGTSWWRNVLLPDPMDKNRAYVQKSGPYEGFFLSQTTLTDNSKPVTSVERYVDASAVPYIVFPGPFSARKGTGHMGDLGYAMNLDTGQGSAFVVAEVGPKAALGEMSIALAKTLGGQEVSARTGLEGSVGRLLFIVFPYSRQLPSWPLSADRLQELVAQLLEQNGGLETVKACLTATGK